MTTVKAVASAVDVETCRAAEIRNKELSAVCAARSRASLALLLSDDRVACVGVDLQVTIDVGGEFGCDPLASAIFCALS